MLTPSTLTIAQGTTGTCTVSTTLLSGVSQQIEFDTASLPPDAWAQFAPPIVNVAQDTILTIYTFDTPVGTYEVTIEANGAITSQSAVLTLIVTASDFDV